MIKALEKQLADERGARSEYGKTNIEMKKQMGELESKYKSEVLIVSSTTPILFDSLLTIVAFFLNSLIRLLVDESDRTVGRDKEAAQR